MVAHAVGRAYFERQLWGKARRQLEIAARTAAAPAAVKRDAWLHLAHIAAQEDKPERVAECHEQAALVA
jgi:HemY protein